jgi:hypothetical protein
MMIMMIKSKMRWRLRIPRMGEIRNSYNILVKSLNLIGHSEELVVDVKIILKLVLRQ